MPDTITMEITRDDISVFDSSAGKGRGSNDSMNKTREAVFTVLYNPPTEFLDDPRWVKVRNAWHDFLPSLYSGAYDEVRVNLRGGRSHHIDFDIHFLLDSTTVHMVEAEFKHNARDIKCLPQYLSKPSHAPYIPTSYAEFFYDSYIDRVCQVYPEVAQHKPDRETYVRLVHGSTYDRHPFFSALYSLDTTGCSTRKKQKDALVKQSIKEFLTLYAAQLDMEFLTQDIQKTQRRKTFILWDLAKFHIDSIREDEMEIVGVGRTKNNNTLVAISRSGTEHHMLLRWKNHLGVLFPAWQIKLVRQ